MDKLTILVPTDFSESAFQAAKYACEFASKYHFSIHLFHCYTSSTALFDKSDTEETDNSHTMKADTAMIALKELLQSKYLNISISTKITRGLLSEILPKYAIEPNFSLIIMGTTGSGENKSIAWGSSTSLISSKSTIPVIAVPKDYDAFALSKIAILSNFKNEEIITIQKFKSIAGNISHLDIIHIYEDEWFDEDVTNEMNKWVDKIKQLNIIEHIQYIAEKTDDSNEELDSIIEVINNLITKEKYDLLLVTKTKKSFLQKLISQSISKQVALNLKIPSFFDNII